MCSPGDCRPGVTASAEKIARERGLELSCWSGCCLVWFVLGGYSCAFTVKGKGVTSNSLCLEAFALKLDALISFFLFKYRQVVNQFWCQDKLQD